MWQVERHLGRCVDVDIVGEGIPGIRRIRLSGFYMIKDSVYGNYVYDTQGIHPRKWEDSQVAINFCARLIEQDFPEAVKHASK